MCQPCRVILTPLTLPLLPAAASVTAGRYRNRFPKESCILAVSGCVRARIRETVPLRFRPGIQVLLPPGGPRFWQPSWNSKIYRITNRGTAPLTLGTRLVSRTMRQIQGMIFLLVHIQAVLPVSTARESTVAESATRHA